MISSSTSTTIQGHTSGSSPTLHHDSSAGSVNGSRTNTERPTFNNTPSPCDPSCSSTNSDASEWSAGRISGLDNLEPSQATGEPIKTTPMLNVWLYATDRESVTNSETMCAAYQLELEDN